MNQVLPPGVQPPDSHNPRTAVRDRVSWPATACLARWGAVLAGLGLQASAMGITVTLTESASHAFTRDSTLVAETSVGGAGTFAPSFGVGAHFMDLRFVHPDYSVSIGIFKITRSDGLIDVIRPLLYPDSYEGIRVMSDVHPNSEHGALFATFPEYAGQTMITTPSGEVQTFQFINNYPVPSTPDQATTAGLFATTAIGMIGLRRRLVGA